MGRVFVRENLAKSATKSSLFTRDNYQYLVKNGWSLSACEQVLLNHQEAKGRGFKKVDMVNKPLNNRIRATSSLAELRGVVEEQAHTMSQINCAVVIQRVPQLLHTPQGSQEYAAAALLLDHMANLLQPKLKYLSGSNICSCISAFVKCRYSPSGDMLQQMQAELLADNARKLNSCNTASLGQLMLALSRLVQPQGQWPLLQAVQDITTQRLQAAIKKKQVEPEFAGGMFTNGIALLAWQFESNQLPSHAFQAALHQWIAKPQHLEGLGSIGAVQLWQALRLQYSRHVRLLASAGEAAGSDADDAEAVSSSSSGASSSSSDTAAATAGADSSSTAAAADAGESKEPAAAATDGDAAAGSAADADADSGSVEPAAAVAAADPLAEQQVKLREFFGPGTLDSLAAATAQRMSTMTERELGQVLASVGSLQYCNSDLLAAAAAGISNMSAVASLSLPTCLSAAWVGVKLHSYRSELLQPALIAAVSQPSAFDGNLAGRLLRMTSRLPADVAGQQQQLLREEMHRRSGQRGPVPDAAADGSSNFDWVTAIADDISQRVGELKPRELAHILSAFSSIPGVTMHEALFGAAAKHIEAHAHMFTQFRDMEMVASAFERMNYKEGLPALKALQQQTEQLAAK